MKPIAFLHPYGVVGLKQARANGVEQWATMCHPTPQGYGDLTKAGQPVPVYLAEELIDVNVRGWMPIETAPKDGRRVLVWMNEESLKRDQRQVQFARLWFYEDGTLGGGAEGFNGKWNITHWMPVPESPNVT